MTSIKSLLEQSQDVAKMAEASAEKLWGYEDEYDDARCEHEAAFRKGHKSRDAEVEKLKRVIIELSETIYNKAYCNCQESIAQGYNVKPCWGCVALAKAREILGGGENGKD